MTRQTIVIDGANHLLGRLASVVAKQLLSGNKVVVVRCEQICKSGTFKRMLAIFKEYRRKRVCSNHAKGPYHQRAPSMIFLKAVRGMLPCRTERGKEALKRLKTYEGVPPKYATVKRMVVPGCNRVICLKPSSKFEKLERLSTNYGWKYKDVVARLEAKRKISSAKYYKKKVKMTTQRESIAKGDVCTSQLKQIDAELRLLDGSVTCCSQIRPFTFFYDVSKINYQKNLTNEITNKKYLSLSYCTSCSVKYKIAKLPSLSPTMEQGAIKCWDKTEGDFLEEGDTLAQIETDKAVMAMETPYKGYLAKILHLEGTSGISINEPIAIIVSKKDDIEKISSLTIDQLKTGNKNSNDVLKPSSVVSSNLPTASSPTAISKNYPKHKLVKLPSLSPTMEHGTVTAWKKSVGDKLDEGDELALVETDKAVMTMETPYKGYLAKILIPENTSNIFINEPIAVITAKKDDVALFKDFSVASNTKSEPEGISIPQTQVITEIPTPNVSTNSPRIKASPFAKKLGKELDVDLSKVVGSGPKGRIISSDVKAFVDAKPISIEPSPVILQTTTSINHVDIPLTNMRKVIATRLTQSKQTIPHYYLNTEICMDRLILLRSEFNKKLSKDNTKLSFNDFVVKAASVCLAAIPESNSAWMDTFIRQYRNVDINIAVSTDSGLITPFVRDVNQKGLVQISNEVKQLVVKARENRLSLNEFQGGTFTISNLGMYGITSFCAVINPPQSAILAVGSINKIIVPDEENKPVVKSVMQVTLSADHRIIDGALGAVWVKKFKSLLEDPVQMLL